MSKHTVIPVLIAVFVITLGFGMWFIHKQGRSSPEKITLADASQPVFALVYIAEAKGYFADEGLEVTYKAFTSGRDALASVIQGESDIATVYETPVVLETYNGEELSVISTLHNSTENTALVARKDHGITTPSDLDGKAIAVSKNTNGEFFLFLYLTSQGIDLSNVTFVDTPPQDMAKVLKDGAVDAVATWNPNLLNTQQALGEGETVTFFSDVYTELSVLAGERDVVSERKGAMRRLLAAIVRAEEFVHGHEDEALDIVVHRLSHLSREIIHRNWDAFTPVAKLDNVMLTIFKQEATWFKEAGRFHAPVPDFREVVFPDYLRRIRPGAVTVW